MANIKPVGLTTGHHVKKADQEARQRIEDSLKGAEFKRVVPSGLTEEEQEIYARLMESFPDGFLTDSDTYTMKIVVNSLAMMQQAKRDVNERGQLLENDAENPSIRVYERYSKIYNTFGSKLGLSPRDRASLAVMLVNQENDKKDPLLEALRDD